jgi:hypothetical protein
VIESLKNRLHVSAKINKYGATGIVCCVLAFAVPFRYPFCLLMLIAYLCALTCGVVAATRGSKLWLILSVISALLATQTVLAVIVEC